MSIPRSSDLFNPLLTAIKRLGGSASIAELDEEVTKNLNLTEEEIAQRHDNRYTELQYQLAWARSYLKAYGLLDNSERGVWVLTPKGKDADAVDPRQIVRFVQERSRGKKGKLAVKNSESPIGPEIVGIAEAVLEESWREELLERLLKLPPDAFERLSQRLLRESGFVEVKVTGHPGDGGIDGVGIIRLGGLLGFPVLFLERVGETRGKHTIPEVMPIQQIAYNAFTIQEIITYTPEELEVQVLNSVDVG